MKTTASGTGSRAARTPKANPSSPSSTASGANTEAGCDAAFDVPIRLTGYRGPLASPSIAALLALGVGFAFLWAPLSAWITVLGAGAGACIALQAHLAARATPAARLVIDRRGHVLYRETRDTPALRGTLEAQCWERSRHTIITVRFPWGREYIPIRRKEQAWGEYRRLRVWLRNGRTREEGLLS